MPPKFSCPFFIGTLIATARRRARRDLFYEFQHDVYAARSARHTHIFKLEVNEGSNNRTGSGSTSAPESLDSLEEYEGGYEVMFEKENKKTSMKRACGELASF
jgi:hypothetical protein